MCAAPKAPQLSDTGTEEGEEKPIVFPHAKDWEQPAVHGESVLRYGAITCVGCHPVEKTDAQEIPGCFSCHPFYPHSAEWVKKENHATQARLAGTESCATQCHGPDMNGGLSGVSCVKCHSITPHSSTWAEPENHGEEGKKEKRALCMTCHGPDLQGGLADMSCFQCHANYPHTNGWAEGEVHGAFATTAGEAACATQCHGTDLGGGLSKVACAACHGLAQHPDNWVVLHGETANNLGTDACKTCHGQDFLTPLGGKNCFSCHPDFPHPESVAWIGFESGHGGVMQTELGGDLSECQLCHGADLRTDKGGRNCFSCHPSYPHKLKTSLSWNAFEGHGDYALSNTTTECQQCHGSDYQGGTRSNPSCFTCHPPYPHTEGWIFPVQGKITHGQYAVANGTGSCATERCHGPNLEPIPGISKAPQCSSCHNAVYPHQAGFSSGRIHGPVALANIDQCKTCHGTGLDTAPAGVSSCKDCHATYLLHSSADLGNAGWSTFSSHGIYLKDNNWDKSQCVLCHGSDYLGGLSQVSCKNSMCHSNYPHTSSLWNGKEHGTYVIATLKGDKSACQVCHGLDANGGHSGVSCQNCHNAFTHADPKWAAGGTGLANNVHATTFVARIRAGENTACTECHGTNYSNVLAGKSCLASGCHSSGVTHRGNWFVGAGHGASYAASFRSTTFGTSKCSHCHGTAVNFTVSQTKTALAAQSVCYKCHNAYPHIGFVVSGVGVRAWDGNTRGHASYINAKPVAFTDASGNRPTTNFVPAITHTCGGGEAGSCHYNPNPPTAACDFCHD